MNKISFGPNRQRAVDEAAEKLLASGVRRTVQRLHELFGGDPRALRPMLEDWRNRLASRASSKSDRPSEELAEELARKKIDSVRSSLRERIRTSRQRISSLGRPEQIAGKSAIERSDVVRIDRELRELQSHLAAHTELLNEIRATAEALQGRAANLRKRPV